MAFQVGIFFWHPQKKQTTKRKKILLKKTDWNKLVLHISWWGLNVLVMHFPTKSSASMPHRCATCFGPRSKREAVSVQMTSGQKRRKDRHQKGEAKWVTEGWNSFVVKKLGNCHGKFMWLETQGWESWRTMMTRLAPSDPWLLHEKQPSFQKLCPRHGGISNKHHTDSPSSKPSVSPPSSKGRSSAFNFSYIGLYRGSKTQLCGDYNKPL